MKKSVRAALLSCLFLAMGTLAPPLVHAGVHDVAVFAPGVTNWMSASQQNALASYLTTNVTAASIQTFNYSQQSALVTWMNANMSDGESDVLLIADLAPQSVYGGEDDGSLAEQWIDNGNLIIWTGSEAFHSYVNSSGTISSQGAGNSGANEVLDVAGTGLCTGYSSIPQKATSAVTQTTNLPDLNLNYASADASSMRSLKYLDIINKAQSVTTWDDAPNMLVDEMFAENDDIADTTHVYESDAVVLTKRDMRGQAGQYAQFYCYKGLIDGVDVNEYRKPALAEFLNNWVSKPVRLIWVDANAQPGGDGSENDPYKIIQDGIDAAEAYSRDRVIVKAGLYYEQLAMKASVKMISDDSNGGNTRVANPVDPTDPNKTLGGHAETYGQVSKKLLQRAVRTIIDGTGGPSGIDGIPMADFPRGSTLGSWIDGFNVQNMPQVNHEIPGHAHVIQTRGASATVVDNVVHNNGSSGLGSHAWFFDQGDGPVSIRDFRYSNVQYDAHPILVNNVVYHNEGNNLGNNHYSYSIMFHNECFDNVSVNGHASPSIGCQHGAHPYVYDNLVYESDWVGIGARRGIPQGRCEVINNVQTRLVIDRPTRPTVLNNRVFASGQNNGIDPYNLYHGAGIGSDTAGGFDYYYTQQNIPHLIENNYADGASQSAIGCRYTAVTSTYQGSDPVCDSNDGIVEPADVIQALELGRVEIKNNTAKNGGKVGTLGLMGAGIGIDGEPNIVSISGNTVSDNAWAGIGIKNNANVDLISNNTIFNNGEAGIGIDGANVNSITSNSSYGNMLAGIGMKNGTTVNSISANTLHNNGTCGIAHDGSTTTVMVNEETDNIIYTNADAGIALVHTNVTAMSRNTISNNAYPGITVTSGSTVNLIDYNTLTGNGKSATTGMSIIGGSSANLSNNTITNSGTTNLSVLDAGSSATLTACNLSWCASPNLKIGAGTSVTVTNCNLSHSTNAPNISINGAAVISGSVFSYASQPGIEVDGTGAVVSLNNNTVTLNGTAGVSITNGATVTSFNNNYIADNATAGLNINNMANNLVINNSTIKGSGTTGVISINNNITLIDSAIVSNGTTGLNMTNGTVNANNSRIDNNGTIGISAGGNVTVTNNSSVSGNGTLGISASGNAALSITNSTINSNTNIGISLTSANLAITGCTVEGNGHWGFSTTGTSGSITNCLIARNGNLGGGHANITNGIALISGNAFDDAFGNLGLELYGANYSPTVSNNNFTGNFKALNVYSGVSATINGNHFESNSFDLKLQSANASIYQNEFIDSDRGIEVITGATGDIFNNTIIGNGSVNGPNYGIRTTGYSTLVAKNNIINKLPVGITDYDNTATEDVSHNDVWSCRYRYTNITDPNPGDLNANPLLAPDYTLTASSPCIDAGTNVGLPYNGAAPDMGAHER